MKKHILSSLLALSLTLGLSVPALAAGEPSVAEVTVNGEAVYYTAEVYDGTAYIPFYGGVQTLRPDAEITWEDGTFTASAWDLTMTVKVGDPYLIVNGRYLYIPEKVKGWADGTALVPARVLATALGAWIGWSGKVELCSGGVPLKSEDIPYDEWQPAPGGQDGGGERDPEPGKQLQVPQHGLRGHLFPQPVSRRYERHPQR